MSASQLSHKNATGLTREVKRPTSVAAMAEVSCGHARRYWEKRIEEECRIKRCSQIENAIWANIYCTIRDRRRSRPQKMSSNWESSQSDTPSSVSVSSGQHTPSSASVSSGCYTPSPVSVSSGCYTPSPCSSPQSPEVFIAGMILNLPCNPATPARSPEEVRSPTSPSESEPSLQSSYSSCDEKQKRLSVISQRFLSACYFEPRPVPVRFSSTVLIQINSTRKQYVEHVQFQTRLVPRRYSEGVSKTMSEATQLFLTALTIPCNQQTITMLSIEPHQATSVAKLTNGATLTKEEFL